MHGSPHHLIRSPRQSSRWLIARALLLVTMASALLACGDSDPQQPVEQQSVGSSIDMHDGVVQDMPGSGGMNQDMGNASHQDMSSPGWGDLGSEDHFDMAAHPGTEPWQLIEMSGVEARFARALAGTTQERFIQISNLSTWQEVTLERFDLLAAADNGLTDAQREELMGRLEVRWFTAESPELSAEDNDLTLSPGQVAFAHILDTTPEQQDGSAPRELPDLYWSLAPEVGLTISLEKDAPCLTIEGLQGATDQGREGLAINLGEVEPYEPSEHAIAAHNCSPSKPLKIRDVFVSRDPLDALDVQSLVGTISDVTEQLVEIGPGEEHAIVVEVSPLLDLIGAGASVLPYLGQLTLLSDAIDFEHATIELFAREDRFEDCPPFELTAFDEDDGVLAIATAQGSYLAVSEPLRQLKLMAEYDASREGPGTTPALTWSLVARPETSTTTLLEDSAPLPGEEDEELLPTTVKEERELFFDVPGEYVIEVQASSSMERSAPLAACKQRRLTFEVIPTQDIYVSTTWETPLDTNPDDRKGADLDLHYIHPAGAFEDPFHDIFWRNRTADWGVPGPQGNPALLRDDRDGAGPEVLAHQDPVEGLSYDVGVYYFDDAGFQESLITTNIYLRGQLAATSRRKPLTATGQYLQVGKVHWSSSQPSVRLIEQVLPTPP